MRKNFSITMMILILFSFSIYAKGKAGTKSASFVTLGYGARALAMSGAYTAEIGDIYSAIWNPAGLAILTNHQMAVMHNDLPADISFEYLTYGLPVKIGYMALTTNYGKYGSESITTYSDNYGTNTGSFDGSDLMINLSYGRKLTNKKFLLGFNLKYIKQEIYKYSDSAYAIDLGMIYKYKSNVNLGFGIYNIGSKIKFIEKDEEIPLQVKFGISAKWFDMLTTNGDLVYTKDEDFEMALGVEFKLTEEFALRGGFNSVNDLDGFTLGFGLNFSKVRFDYAYEPYGEFEQSHKISLDYTFGNVTKKVKKNIINEFRKRVEPQPETASDLIKKGYASVLDGDYFTALFEFNDAVMLEPENINARLWLAYTHTKLGNLKFAINEYKNVLKLDPTNPNALQALRLLGIK